MTPRCHAAKPKYRSITNAYGVWRTNLLLIMKKNYSLILLAIATLLSQGLLAADPDLSGYTLIKTMDFSTTTYLNDTKITLDATSEGTAWETGNGKQQTVTDVLTPEDLKGYLAFQGVYGSKGWWIRSTKGGLYSYGATRSAAVINMKAGYVVAFNCTQDAGNVMTLTNGDAKPDGNFTFVKSDDTKTYFATMTADGNVGFCGVKSAGYISSIKIYAPGVVIVKPAGAYTAVNGKSRTVTFTGANLAYNTDGSTNYTNFKDNEGNNVNTASVTVSDSTKYYVVSTNGTDKSDVLEFDIAAGTELSLANPTVSVVTMSEGYTKNYLVTCDNSKVLLFPKATLTYSFVSSGDASSENNVAFSDSIKATQAGTYTVTASADGYASTTETIDNTLNYKLTKTIDMKTLTAADLSSNWKLKSSAGVLPGSSNQWPAYFPSVTADEYYYDFSSATASATDIIPGLNVEFTTEGKTPRLYLGFGFMYPIYLLNADGTDNTTTAINGGNISIADGTAKQYGVYTYLNNYSKNGTKTAVVAGNSNFALYRFSDALIKVAIYTPTDVPTAIREVDGTVQSGSVYTVSGIQVRKGSQSLEGLSKGLYIANGKKFVVK